MSKDDLRWRTSAVKLAGWTDWFETQLRLSGKAAEAGLWVGLRLDGRVSAGPGGG